MRQIIDKYSQVDLDDAAIDKLLNYNEKSKEVLRLASERDALEESLDFLKARLKKGTPIAEVSKQLRPLFEEMFDNQLRINNLR